MIKIAFGASVVAVATTAVFELSPGQKQNHSHTLATPREERTVLDSSPSVINLKFRPAKKVLAAAAVPEAGATFEPGVTEAEEAPPVIAAAPVSKDTLRQDTALYAMDTIFKNVKRVEVDLNFCNLRMSGHYKQGLRMQASVNESGETTVCGTRAYRKTRNVLRYKQEKDLLKVWMEIVKLDEKERVDFYDGHRSLVDLQVPDGVEISVHNHSGNVGLADADVRSAELKADFGNLSVSKVKGDLSLFSSSGNIRCTEVNGKVNSKTDFGNSRFDQVNGDLFSHASSGHVTVNGLVGNAEVTTSFGNQKFIDVKGNIDAKASSGGIRLQKVRGDIQSVTAFGTQHFEDIEGAIHADASSGNIAIQNSKGKLTLSTSFGGIKGAEVTVMNGCDLKANSGNIVIDFTNSMDELKFDLRSSSGTVRVGDGDKQSVSRKDLQVGSGSILVTGSTTFGNQTYK